MTVTVEEIDRTEAPFGRVASKDYGYNVKQVDQFLDRARAFYTSEDTSHKALTSHEVRAVSFDPAKGGYEARAVDAALDRLEDVFVQRERDELIAAKGEDAWLLQIGKIASVLRGRLHRPDGERFRRAKGRVASYSTDDVDALCVELVKYFEEDKPLSVDVIRRAVFAPATGAAGYDEAQVDAFLDRVVEMMASID
ncbi:DivIVA domain-containing protein [Arthrobacter sp. 35W]|uniref:DivIVA domain-containing protein n=1 Tax=Arthrobacter sp. 35W TaxID=1132441 RepID=UPI0012DE6695|nr:DivIVA domain-containing protein [Arthrobacter sp. 35W]